MLQELKQYAIDTLMADPYFGDAPGIEILDERKFEIDNAIDIALSNVSGLAVLVTVPNNKISDKSANLPYPYFDSIILFCRVYENPTLNSQNPGDGTGKNALNTAEKIAALLHMKRPYDVYEPLVCTGVQLGDDPNRSTWDVVFVNRGGVKDSIPTVATPTISIATGTATITCATAGAAIFYSLDGSAPTPRSGHLYTGPFSVASGLSMRVRAWLAGYTGSLEATTTT